MAMAVYGKAISFLGRVAPKVTKFINNTTLVAVVAGGSFSIYEDISQKIYVRKKCGSKPTMACLSSVIHKLPADHPAKVGLQRSLEAQ